MLLNFYGATQEVGRSCIVLEDRHKALMLDCGIKLGEKIGYPLLADNDLKKIHHIIISHAHLDHSGYLPHIYAKRFSPAIWTVKPTRDLMGVLLADYHRLQRRPVFRQKDVNNVLQKTRMIEYQQPAKAAFPFSLHNAGHILGSAMIRVDAQGGIVYTGDICMRSGRILDGAEKGLRAKTLITETTYGGKNDILPSYKSSGQKLIKSINKTLNEGGHVLIPSFAVGRAQEVLLLLDDYIRGGALGKTKIFIEGMINKAMRIYRHNAYYANDDIKKRILMSEDDPFKSPFFNHSRSKDRKDVLKEPCIIVSTSGMLSGGPALFYLEKFASNPKNKLIFVGYQAEGTLGRKIMNGERKIKLNNKDIELRLKIEDIRLSAHADFNELQQFAHSIKGLKRIFLIHGEKTDLGRALERKYEVITPKLGDSYPI